MHSRCAIAAAVTCACAAAAAFGAVVPSWPEYSPKELAKGRFLVASERLNGSYFQQSVILLIEHGPGGALGVVINRPTAVPLAQLLPNLEALQKRDDRAFAGGPVAPRAMMILFRAKDPPPNSRHVFADIYASGNFDTLKQIVESDDEHTSFRAYAGNSGWAPRQLEGEVLRGSWAIVSADADAVFEMDPSAIWPKFKERSDQLEANRRSVRDRFL